MSLLDTIEEKGHILYNYGIVPFNNNKLKCKKIRNDSIDVVYEILD